MKRRKKESIEEGEEGVIRGWKREAEKGRYREIVGEEDGAER